MASRKYEDKKWGGGVGGVGGGGVKESFSYRRGLNSHMN